MFGWLPFPGRRTHEKSKLIRPFLNQETHKRITREHVLVTAHGRLMKKGSAYRASLKQLLKEGRISPKKYDYESHVLEYKLEHLLEKKMAQMKRLSERDPKFSSLFNRKKMERVLQDWFANRDKKPFSVIFLDIDHFKKLNDTFGHETGDAVLNFLSTRLNELARKNKGEAGRWGGEEFVAVVPITPSQAGRLMHQLKERLISDFELGKATATRGSFYDLLEKAITFSAGIARSGHGNDWIDLVSRADALMYESKHAGRDRVTISSDDVVTTTSPV